MKYCTLCAREVGVEKVRPTLSTAILIILGLIVPLWPLTLPLFWGLAIINWVLRSTKVCGVCKSRNLTAIQKEKAEVVV